MSKGKFFLSSLFIFAAFFLGIIIVSPNTTQVEAQCGDCCGNICASPRPTLTPSPTPICQETTWSCEACQKLNDDICYNQQAAYCTDFYGCGWTECPKDSECIRKWVCEDTCEVPQIEKSFKISGAEAKCTGDFEVKATIKEDGVAKEGIEVFFKYKNEEKTDLTDDKGEAAVTYNWGGVYPVTAYSPNYGTISKDASHDDDCPAGEELEVAGAVLGISTMADTGVANDMIGLMFAAGSLLTSVGLASFKSKKN